MTREAMMKELRQVPIVIAVLTVIIANVAPIALGDDNDPIPGDKSQLNAWFDRNVKPLELRKGSIDPNLEVAESNVTVIKVAKDGSGDFKTLAEAINSIPAGNSKRVIVNIGPGEYVEKVKIERTKPFITLHGSPNNMPNLTFGGTALQYGTVDSATLIVESDYFTAVNIVIKNSAPRPSGKNPKEQAVAIRVSGDKSAFYNCKFIGFQDTICDDRGFHFFKDCYVEGTVDFIFGSGKSLYVGTQLNALGDEGYTFITAQARETSKEDTGFSFVQCSIFGTGNNTYLGRAWKSSPRVLFAYTNMTSVIVPVGWSDNMQPSRDSSVDYGEYKNTGEGSKPEGRVKYAKQLTDAEAKPFLTLSYIIGSKWLLPPPKI